MKEIGSEYWLSDIVDEVNEKEIPKWLNIGVDNRLLLSGRTSLHYILEDIMKANASIKNVYFPSYCCQSMLQPFIDLNFNIIFYEVKCDKGLKFDIDFNKDCDIFFAMNYFGFENGRMDRFIDEFKKKNVIVIEDATHSFLSKNQYNLKSDYIIISLRKWFPIISGGLAVKTTGHFLVKHYNYTFEEMVRIRKSAMFEKGNFISGEQSNIDKSLFLKKYKIANEMLNFDYKLYSIDRESYYYLNKLDIDSIKIQRKNNSKLLYQYLSNNENFDLLIPKIEEDDCPIFIPIIFTNSKERNELKDFLVKNNIYSPIHWPKPNILSDYKSSICDFELSLIVDQRYEESDMHNQIRRILKYYEK